MAYNIDLSVISDRSIEHEYLLRFTLKAGDMIQNAEESVLHLRPYFDDPYREKFIVIFLNGRNQVIGTEVLFEGSLTTSAVYPREVIRRIIHHGAAAIVLGHNHPSGNNQPSQEDFQITKRLKEAAATIDVVIHDHIIVAGGSFYSFSDNGII